MKDCKLCGAKVVAYGANTFGIFHARGCSGALDREGNQEGRDGTDEAKEFDFKSLHKRGLA